MNRKVKKLSELSVNFDHIRVPLSSTQRQNLKRLYPYYGAQNVIDYVDDFLFDGEFLLIAEDGANLVGQNANVCNIVTGKFWVNNHAHIVKGKEGNLTRYLYYYLNLLDFKPFVTGSAQPKLTKENLESIPVNVHSLEEQKEIVRTLDSLDEQIKLNNKINAKLESMAKLIYDYWFVQFDFPDENGNPYKSSGGKMVWSEELKRLIPDGWKSKDLRSFVNIFDSQRIPVSKRERELRQGPYPYYGATGLMDHINDYIFDGQYLLLAEDGSVMDTNGYPNLQYISGKFWVNNHAHILQAREEKNNEYLFRTLKLIPAVQMITGSVQMKVNQENLLKNKILIPSHKCLEKYSIICMPIRDMIFTNNLQNNSLSNLRDWLLPMLMNGQVKIVE